MKPYEISRQEKLSEEMRFREKRCDENRKEQELRTRSRQVYSLKKMESKEKKVDKLLSQREQSIIRARKMAETSAKLREILKTQK